MPLYEYECTACGHRFELIQKFADAAIEQCPSCGELKVKKLLSSPAIQFKGTGWYITDYAKKSEGAKESAKESGESKESAKESGKDSKESRESRESSKESKESKKQSTESKSPTTSTATPKASGE